MLNQEIINITEVNLNVMKKAILITTVSGFVPQFEMNNVRILQDMGYEVHYASNYHNPSYGKDNHRLDNTNIIRHQVDFVRSPFRFIKNIKAYLQLQEILKNDNYELVHCHTPMGALLGRLAARGYRKQGCRVFYTVHGFHFYKGASLINWLFYYPVERFMMRYTDVLLTITKEDYDRAYCFKRKSDQKVYYIPGVGIDTNRFMQIEQGRIETGGTQKVRLLSVGELNSNKNHIAVIRALGHLKRNNIIYMICGDGAQKEKLRMEIQKKHLQKKVFLLGYRENIEEILAIADVFVFPSQREGLSVALQEAMAAGLPAVVSDIRGNRELIDEGLGGYRVEANDYKAWADTIDKIIKADKKKMGKYNQNKIKSYDLSCVSALMRKVYSENLV